MTMADPPPPRVHPFDYYGRIRELEALNLQLAEQVDAGKRRVADLEGANRYLTNALDTAGDLLGDAEAKVLELEQRWDAELEHANRWSRRAQEAEAERDALRARVFEVEQRQVGYVLVSFASHQQWKAELAELDTLRAQVAAARAECAAFETEHLYARDIEYGVSVAAGRVLAAMDGAKP